MMDVGPGGMNTNLAESFETNDAGVSNTIVILLAILVLVLVSGLATGIYFLVRWQKQKKKKKGAQPPPVRVAPPLVPNGQGVGAARQVVYMPRQDQEIQQASVQEVQEVQEEVAMPMWDQTLFAAQSQIFHTDDSGDVDVIYIPGAAPPPPPLPAAPPNATPTAPRRATPTKPTPAAPTPASIPSGAVAWNEALPLPNPAPLRKNVAPWNITTISNESAMSSQEGGIRFSYKKGVAGGKGGGSFKANPNKALPAEGCVLSYDVFFPSGFTWVKGGKLPGICLGTKPDECATGKEWSATAGSIRVNFREGGAAAVYMYMAIPGGSDAAYAMQGSKYKDAADIGKRSGEDNAPGHHVWLKKSGGLRFKSGEFNSVRLQVTLNTPGLKNGSLSLTVNGETRSLNDVVFRTSASVRINAVNFVSFFGGKIPSPVDTYSVVKNVRFGIISTR